jgi:dUTP pyrophosphatase
MIKVKRIGNHETPLPERKTIYSAGLDLYAPESLDIPPGWHVAIPSGFAFEIPQGFYGQIKERSSLALRRLIVHGGVIDSDYRGEIKILLFNESDEPQEVQKHERIAQLLILPCSVDEVVEVGDLSETDRGAGGFGSTGAF